MVWSSHSINHRSISAEIEPNLAAGRLRTSTDILNAAAVEGDD
jgi:hypothetical protein